MNSLFFRATLLIFVSFVFHSSLAQYDESFVITAASSAVAPAAVSVTVDLLNPPFFNNGGAGIIIDCYSDGRATQYFVTFAYWYDRPSIVTATCNYNTPGFYCISACVDSFSLGNCALMYYDAIAGSCVPSGSRKRDTYNSRVIRITSSAGGDPYFYGFDGKIQKFDGKVDETYNLISTPTLQLNSWLGSPWDHSKTTKMGTSVIRTVGLMWSPLGKLTYTCNYTGETFVKLMSRENEGAAWREFELSLDGPVLKLEMANASLVWIPNANSTRQVPHLNPHFINSSLSITTPDYEVVIFSVEMVTAYVAQSHQEKEHGFNFIDVDFSRLNKNECFEGAWGRSSCYYSSEDKFDPELYNVKGDLFGTGFRANLYQV